MAAAKRLGEITWHQPQVKGESPSPRSGHTITVDSTAGKAMLFGGCGVDAKGEPAVFNETWLLTTQEPMTWENADVMGDVPSPRWRHTATLLPENGGILVFGGLYKGKRYNDVHVFNVEKKEWVIKECSGTPPHPRSHHTSSLVSFPAEPLVEGEQGDGKPKEDRLYVIGGYGGAGTARDFFSDIHVLDLLTWTWTKVRCAAAGTLALLHGERWHCA